MSCMDFHIHVLLYQFSMHVTNRMKVVRQTCGQEVVKETDPLSHMMAQRRGHRQIKEVLAGRQVRDLLHHPTLPVLEKVRER